MARTIKECLEQGPYTSKEIQAMTGVSQSTVARRLIEMADRVVQIREGRSIRYAAACNGNLHSHVIVKFSPKGDTDIAQRWKDILITEYHAARIINTKLHPAAYTRLFEMDGRFFLQTQRFDRIKAFGRSSMISLQAIDNEFTGIGHNWVTVMTELFNRNIVSEKDLVTTRYLWHFGRLINNTDMHPGNLSLSMENESFRLLPVYDMCSMGFAPGGGGEVQPFAFKAPDILNADLTRPEIETIKNLAYEFWENVSKDHRISRQFKTAVC